MFRTSSARFTLFGALFFAFNAPLWAQESTDASSETAEVPNAAAENRVESESAPSATSGATAKGEAISDGEPAAEPDPAPEGTAIGDDGRDELYNKPDQKPGLKKQKAKVEKRRRRLDTGDDQKAGRTGNAEDGDAKSDLKPGGGEQREDKTKANKTGVGGYAQWDDAQEMGKMIGHGSIGVCELLTAPLGLIPTVGTVLGFALEIACLYPGALSIDYVSLFHGKTDSQLWQATAAVILAKIWRVGTRFAAIGAILGAGIVTLGAGALIIGGFGLQAYLTGANVAGAAVPLIWAPTIAGTVLVLSGLTYIGLRKIRKYGQSKIYDWVYVGLTDDFESAAAQKTAQEAAYVHPPLSWWERAWVLMAMADGSEAETHPSHWIPVVGRVIKSGDQAAALKKHMRKVGKDVVGEGPEDLEVMDRTIDTLAAFEGGFGALAEAGLVVGAIFASAGLAMTAGYFFLNSNLLVYGLVTTGLGLVAMTAGGAGVTFLLLREVPRFFRPFVVPLAYGALPYEWLNDDEGSANAGAKTENDVDADDREME